MLWILLIGLVAGQTSLSSNFYATPTSGETAEVLGGAQFMDDWKNVYCTDTGISCDDVTVKSVLDGSDGQIVVTYEMPVSSANTAALQASNFGEILNTNLQNSPNLGPHFAGQTVTIWFYQKSASQFDAYLETLESSMASAVGVDASEVFMGTPTQSGANVYLTYTIPTDASWSSTGSGSTYEVYLRSMSDIETLNSLTGAFVENMVMFNGDSTIDDLTQYQEELRIAWANSLGVSQTDVEIVNIGPNGMNAITFGHIYSYTAATSLASDTFYDTWRTELSQIDGLNSILGLTATSLTVQLSDVTVSGFMLQFVMTEPISGAMVYWTVAKESSGAVSNAQVIEGTGLCDGNVLQSADPYGEYSNCHLDASDDYKLYIYYADGGDGGTVVTSFQTGGQLYVAYTYTFLDTLVADISAYWHLVGEAFASQAGVGTDYIFISSSTDTENGALTQIMFPFTSWTQSVTSESSFVTSFEYEMAKYDELAPFVVSISNVYKSVGGYDYATEADAQAACQTEDATYNLCTKAQLYTVVYDSVDGFSIPELCYSGWLEGGVVGYYHNQEATSDQTCGGADGWQSWEPDLPGAHCCTSFEAVSMVKAAYVKHPSLYAFSSKADAAAACQDYDDDYYLCSKYQLEGIAESNDYSYDMCLGGYYSDGSDDETNGFYVAFSTDSCQQGEVGWHQWCPPDSGLCGAHCCLPSYLDSRTQDMYYGTANGDDGTSTLVSSREYCSTQETFPHVCTSSQLRAVASAENMNICLAGWAESDDDSSVGVLGWWQGSEVETWCGSEGWNDGSFTPIGVAHCCKSYVKEYVEVSTDYAIYPAYYENGFSSGVDAATACTSAGYAGLCSKEQVIWWAMNDDPALCRSGWATEDGGYVTGYYGWGSCGTVGTWHTWAPATPVAHCCNSNVPGASIEPAAYLKTGTYEFTDMSSAAAACDSGSGYSLCSASQLYRVAYGDVDGFSDDNICFSGWVTDGLAGWFQATENSCGGDGWQSWMFESNKAGAHCCLNNFDGWVIPDGVGFEGTTTTTSTEPPEECQWIHVSGLDDSFNGFYQKTGEEFGKFTFTGDDGRFLAYDNEVWSIKQGPQHIVAREVDDTQYPPTTSVWDLAELDTQVAYNGNVLCIDSVHYVIPTVTGLVTGQSLTLRLNGDSGYDILVENPSTSGTFTLSLPEGYGYEVTIEEPSSDSTTCACSGCVGVVPAVVAITCTPSSVTVGGSVNDLADGQSITLQSTIDNTQLITLTNSDDWTFSNEFTVGQVYGVVIAVQPTGQFCTLSNYQGVVTGIIGNVDVQCVDNMYSVSATVYGLNSDGSASASLNMANDVITTNANGVFTFETLMGYGRQYIVSSDDPDGYACTLTNNFGTVTGDVTDIILNCIELVGTSYTVEINFLATRNCLYGNSIQLAEWSFYNHEKQPILYTYATSTPMSSPDSGNEGIQNLYDGNVLTKWLDYTMNPCDASILVHDITLDEEPVYFNFATGNDEPNRDPTEFEVTVCTLVDTVPVSCKTLHYLLEDLSETRSTFLETDFSTTAYSIEIEVLNNNATVVVQNLDNRYGDELTFTVPTTKTFLWQIPQGSSFDVSVSQQPQGQTCTVNGVYQGTVTDAISLSVYCIESCDGPEYIEDLVRNGYPASMADDLCVIEEQYYWGGQPLCIAAAERSLENDTCPYGDKVCAGPLGKTYGGYDMQAQVLLEAFGADDTCKADGDRCYAGAFSCCDPNSACLWYFDATQMHGDRKGFFDECLPCATCDPVLNNCDEECSRDQSDPIFHPRCPPSNCEAATDAAKPVYFEDDIEYCINGVDYYLNGVPTCVNTTTYETQQDQDIALENAFTHDFEFGTDQCSVAKSFPLLMQDHLYIAGIRIGEYQEIVTYALDNCCLEDEDVSPFTDDWQEQITYFETQTVTSEYGADVKSNLRNIVSQLESLLTTLDQL